MHNERGVGSMGRELDRRAGRLRARRCSFWHSDVGFGLPCPLRGVLARSRQPVLGWRLAAIVCQPQLGASLRKGWFRMIGTAVGATMVVVLTALFPQDRIAFLGLLALWGGICAFAATVLR